MPYLRHASLLALLLLSSSLTAAAEPRPHYARGDLPKLRKLDRTGVLAALGSFEDQQLSERDFVLRTAELLDASRIPGLSAAVDAGDARRVAELVFRACRADRPAPDRQRAKTATIAEANEILHNRFTFYGEQHQLPADIDWDSNPGTAHWGHDLNRFTYLSPLMQAYLDTGDERYSRKAVELMLDWAKKCRLERCFQGSPYVWGSYLNNAIHCRTWCVQLPTLIAAEQITPVELLQILKSLHEQLAYLEIVTDGHSGNWPTIGIQGMLGCLSVLPILRDRDRWADYCAKALCEQVSDQVLPDGAQYELTPHYHRVVINNILSAASSLRALGRDLDPHTKSTLGRMVHYYQQCTVPDGSKQVAFNDSDPGSVQDYRRELAELGCQQMLSPDSALGPEVFPYAGVALLRQRKDQGDLYLAFDAGPYGRGHQHEDKLGFWLFAYGRNLIVDPGRHLYDTSAKSYLLYLRSTKAHSTILVDGQGQHSRGKPATWVARQPLDLKWNVSDRIVSATGQYELGYGAQNAIDVVHCRRIEFVDQRYWIIYDQLLGTGEHLVESRFQLRPASCRSKANRHTPCSRTRICCSARWPRFPTATCRWKTDRKSRAAAGIRTATTRSSRRPPCRCRCARNCPGVRPPCCSPTKAPRCRILSSRWTATSPRCGARASSVERLTRLHDWQSRATMYALGIPLCETRGTTVMARLAFGLPISGRTVWYAVAILAAMLLAITVLTWWYLHPALERTDGVVYGARHGKPLKIDVLRPRHSNGRAVAVMISGSWKSSDSGSAPVWLMAPVLRRGYTVFAVHHVSQPEATVMEIVEDVHRAIRFIRYHADEYNIDPDRIGVTGGSSGGHLSLMLATRGGPGPPNAPDAVDRVSSAVQAVAIFFPVTDLLNLGTSTENAGDGGPPKSYVKAFGPQSQVPEVWQQIGRDCSPIYHITGRLPPVLIHHGDADTLTPLEQSQWFCERAAESGQDVTLVVHRGGKHGWLSMIWDVYLFANWFDQHLKPNLELQ